MRTYASIGHGAAGAASARIAKTASAILGSAYQRRTYGATHRTYPISARTVFHTAALIAPPAPAAPAAPRRGRRRRAAPPRGRSQVPGPAGNARPDHGSPG